MRKLLASILTLALFYSTAWADCCGGATETVIQGSAPTSRSGTITTANTSQQLMPAQSRRGWSFQNQSSGICYVRVGAAATADQNSRRFSPGASYETPINYASTAAINVMCTEAGDAFFAEEW